MSSEELPPPSPALMEDRWARIQENTFKNWVNQQLRDTDHQVEEISTEFSDGVKLCTLVAALQNKPNIRGMKANPKNRHQMFENVTLALQATKQDKIKIVNIGAEDIVNGNKKLILGLIWSYILRYQIGKTEIPPKQLMLAWLNAVIPECNIKNFTNDWNNGRALHALIDYCEPGLAPDWRTMSTSDRQGNCEVAMRVAQERLGVPGVVSPQHMASSDLDQLSGMTYLSYFMKINSCGYKATLRDVNKLLPSNHVSNFTSDWRDGSAVCALVQSVGGHIPERPNRSSSSPDPVEATDLGLQAGKEIGVLPILSAEDMVQPQAGHLAVMAYAARFINKPAVRQSAASYIEVLFNTVDIAPGSKTQYTLLMRQGDPRLHSIRVTITDPNGSKVPTVVEWNDQSDGLGTFVPTVTGEHKLTVDCDGEIIRGCPIKFNVAGSKKMISVVKRDQGVVGEASKLEIFCGTDDVSDVQMICTSPSGVRREVALTRSPSSSSLKSTFTPDTVGEWQVSVLCNGKHTSGSPYNMNVIKPQAVTLCNLEGGLIGQQFSFTADTTKAGTAELQCVITLSGRVVPSTIEKTGEGLYSIKFVPTGPGIHLVRPMYGGNDVRDEPYKVEITDSNLVVTDGPGLSLAKTNQSAYFTVNALNAGVGDVTTELRDSSGGLVPSTIRQVADKIYEVEYTPLAIGAHELLVEFDNKKVKGSPFTVDVYNDPKAEVPYDGVVNQPVTILLNTAHTGKGELNIIVNGGTVPVETKKLERYSYSAEFIPPDVGQYVVELEFNNFPIQGSPWYVNVTAPIVRTEPPPPPSVSPAAPMFILPPVINEPPPVLTLPPVLTPSPARTPSPPATSADVYAVVHPRRSSTAAPAQYARVRGDNTFDVTGKKNIVVKIQDMFGAKVPFTITTTKAGLSVLYKLEHVGDHYILINENGKPLRGSPFLVCSFDPSLVVVRDLETRGQVDTPSSFTIDTVKAGRGVVSVLVDKGDVPCNVQSNSDGTFSASYTSTTNGTRNIEVLFNQISVPGSPFHCSYGSPAIDLRQSAAPTNYIVPVMSPVSVTGSGLHIGEEDKMASFIINPFGQQGHPEVRIEGPHSVAKCSVQPVDAPQGKQYKVTYVPVETGIYNVYIQWSGRDIEGSPYHPRVVDSRKVKLADDWYKYLDGEDRLILEVSQNRRLLFDVSQAGPGELKAGGRHVATGTPLQCTVVEKDLYHYWVDIVASEPGDATIDIEWSDFLIPNSPLRAIVRSRETNGHVAKPPKVVLSGFGLETAFVGKPAEFYIDGSLADPGSPEVKLTNSKLETLQTDIVALSAEEYMCTYTVPQPGIYMLHVSWNGNNLQGSPFSVTALNKTSAPSSRGSDGPDKISIRGPGIMPGILAHYDGTFYIDTEDAGKGECVVKVQGPKGDVKIISSLQGPRNRLLQCEYNPTEIGLYVLRIRWSGQDVAGSPIQVHIFDTYEELERFKDSGEISMYMPADDISLHSSIFPQSIANGKRSKSVPYNRGARALPPSIQRSYTAGPRANGQPAGSSHSSRSYFIVKENGPEFTPAPAQRAIFVADQ